MCLEMPVVFDWLVIFEYTFNIHILEYMFIVIHMLCSKMQIEIGKGWYSCVSYTILTITVS